MRTIELPRTAQWGPDAGASLVELLVVLALLALLSTVVAAGLGPLTSKRSTARERIEAFVRDMRLLAVRRGEPSVLLVSPGLLVSGDHRLEWDATEGWLASPSASMETTSLFRVVVFADGSMSGPELAFVSIGESRALSAPWRERPVTSSQ